MGRMQGAVPGSNSIWLASLVCLTKRNPQGCKFSLRCIRQSIPIINLKANIRHWSPMRALDFLKWALGLRKGQVGVP